ncbi:MAG: large repetitive protein [Thermoleophilaceae bacterium]|nr:large repetitive protein [Thermoleophilaceae bacterium]
MSKVLLACACAAVLMALCMPLAAQAATFNVNTTTDQTVTGGCTTAPDCSLRDAVTAADNAPDPSNTINVPSGTYTLSLGSIGVVGPLEIAGAGARTTTIDANGTSRIFDISDGNVSISGLTLTGGNADTGTPDFFAGDGGAILLGSFGGFLGCGCSPSPGLTLTDSVVKGNSATFNGGGIGTATFESPDVSDITIDRSTISDNQVTGGTGGGFGGGIESFGNLTVTNSTVSGNSVSNASATNQGGGIAVGLDPGFFGGSPGTVTILNTTVAGNSVSGSAPGGMGGGISASSGSGSVALDVKNTIVAGNTVDGATADCSGVTTVTSDHNLSGDASCGFIDAGSLPSTDPQLGALADNGGPTDTRKPASASPVIDAGTDTGCPSTDQRGNPRPQGAACDMGALEQAGPELVVRKVGPLENVNPGDDVTYTITAENIGDGDASTVDLSDTLPAHTTFQSLSAPAGWVATTPAVGAAGTVSAHVSTLAAGTRATFTLVVRVDGNAPAGPFANTAAGTTTSTEATLANDSDTWTVTVNSAPPKAVDDSPTVTEDASNATVDVLANDLDGNTGAAKQVSSVTQPAHGAAAVGPSGANVTYTPSADYCNSQAGGTPDMFTYTLASGSTATVSVTVTCVDDAPVAVDDSATVDEDAAATAIDVLANDTDADGGPKTVASVVQPGHGKVTIAGDSLSVSYKPDANFCGSDSFTYKLNGGSQATVSMTVNCVDDAPVAVDDSKTVAQDSAATTIDVLANDTDVDGGAKSVASATQPSHGTVAVAGDSSSVSYQPAAGYCGADSFTYTLNGGSSATVSVTVKCPPVVVDVTPSSIKISHRHVGLEHGVVLLVLKCRGAKGQRCRGTLSINPATGPRRLKAASAYGSARFDIATGKNGLVRIPMSRAVLRKLARTHKLIATVVARLSLPGGRSRLYHRRITIIQH